VSFCYYLLTAHVVLFYRGLRHSSVHIVSIDSTEIMVSKLWTDIMRLKLLDFSKYERNKTRPEDRTVQTTLKLIRKRSRTELST
jgi:hypothetical protein